VEVTGSSPVSPILATGWHSMLAGFSFLATLDLTTDVERGPCTTSVSNIVSQSVLCVLPVLAVSQHGLVQTTDLGAEARVQRVAKPGRIWWKTASAVTAGTIISTAPLDLWDAILCVRRRRGLRAGAGGAHTVVKHSLDKLPKVAESLWSFRNVIETGSTAARAAHPR
jgi:hypothetical protein